MFIFDCTEIRIERPKKDNKKYEPRRKKHPTMKSFLAICAETASIGYTNFSPGSVHDFKLFKDSYIQWLSKYATLIADLGFQGLQKLFLYVILPYKRSKLKDLTPEQKEYNQKISRKRSLVERVIGWLKRFKIISNRYRNNPKKFPEQFDLICAMFNAHLALGKFQEVKEDKKAS
jgi:hypothetical protein